MTEETRAPRFVTRDSAEKARASRARDADAVDEPPLTSRSRDAGARRRHTLPPDPEARDRFQDDSFGARDRSARSADAEPRIGRVRRRAGDRPHPDGFGGEAADAEPPRRREPREPREPRAPRRAEAEAPTFAPAPRRRRGGWLRFLLPLAAVGLVAALFLSSRGGGDPETTALVDQMKIAAGIQVTNPRYNGATADGSPFSLRAAVARPDGPDPTKITLDDVYGRVEMKSERTIEARAATGVFLREENRVRLEGDVVVTSSDGYRASSASAEMDLETETVVTPGRVTATGPVGDLTAGRMRAQRGEGGVVWFDGGVEMTIRRLVESESDGAN